VADIEYKGWTIKPQSGFDRATNRWRPRALLIFFRDRVNRVRTSDSAADVTAETQSLADAYAVVMAKAWVDSHANGKLRAPLRGGDSAGEPTSPASPA
jgi:hypothetical protein